MISKNKSYIYIHKTKDTNEIFYVGVGKNINGYHRAYSKRNRNKHWKNVVNKHGFCVEIIEDNLSRQVALEREKYWIKYYGRKDLNEGILVNMTDGGEGTLGHTHTKNTKLKMSKNHSKHNNPFWGKNHSKKTLKIISDKLSGKKHPWYSKKHSNESKLKMSKAKKGIYLGKNNPNAKQVLDLDTGIFYETKTEIALALNIDRRKLYKLNRVIEI